MKIFKNNILGISVLGFLFFANLLDAQNRTETNAAVRSMDTGLTITKVRTAKTETQDFIVGSSYEGTLIGVSYKGEVQWENKLSGFMNHDIWCQDITGDGNDEILAANADGSLYCLDSEGEVLWKFKNNDAPMNAVTVVHKNSKAYVVCGGYDKNIYYLSQTGELLATLPSQNYSIDEPWGKGRVNGKNAPEGKQHTANFLRTLHKKDGSEILVVHGVMHSMSTPGTLYMFRPLDEIPFKTVKIQKGKTFGSMAVVDSDGDKDEELLMGASSMIHDAVVVYIKELGAQQKLMKINKLAKEVDRFGYRVVQSEVIKENGENKFFTLFGSRILLTPTNLNPDETEVLASKYSFNDMWKDPKSNTILLASAQSGGSGIHLLNLDNPIWKEEYTNIDPPGKIASILNNTAEILSGLKTFKRPNYQREQLPVYFMSEKRTPKVSSMINKMNTSTTGPVFLNGFHMNQAEDWDRSSMENKVYREKRDRRKDYNLSQEEALNIITPNYKNNPGISYWAGHGNDPYMFNIETTKKVLDAANGKKTVLIYPEIEDHSENFKFCLNNLIYPLAEYAQDKNANIYLRNKHVFWLGNIYIPEWKPLVDGKYADVFVPGMEETTDKSMELSLAGRIGLWASGAVNNWGARGARDNPSFDRLRQHSHQMLPNHFLRTMVYSIASGAQYINNFTVDQEYMSLLWKLIDKGALYIPKRSEILSFSPVHLSMKEPDHYFLNEGGNVKWTTFYDETEENNNPLVFSRLNGTWPGAALTEWDFSRYAAGAHERRLNFIPTYNNGMVLITPPQNGVFARKDVPRGELRDQLHPMYKNILKEYVTDGRQYFSKDGMQTYPAQEYYKKIEKDIEISAGLLPITVTGDVGWVVAQVSPKHLRLTLVDHGYINPGDREAEIHFNTINPDTVVDILNKESFSGIDSGSVTIKVPTGGFRFIDIELTEEL